MTTKRKPAGKRPAASWSSAVTPNDFDESEVIAHGILDDRPDLLPSVARIMNAGLDPDGRRRALTLFRDALQSPGDVHRDPRVAIQRCLPDRSTEGDLP